MFADTALAVRLLVYVGLSLFIVNGPYVYVVVCVVYAYNLTLMHVYRTFNTSDMSNKLLKCNLMYWFQLSFYFFWHLWHEAISIILYYIIFVQPCKIAHNMQHALLTPLTYPGSCKTCFFCIPVFGGKISLIFLTSDLWSDLQCICLLAYLT